MGRRRGERERDGDGGLGGGAVETPGSPNRSSSAAALLESCRARFGERERLRLEEDEWRRFFFFFFSFFWPAWKSKFRRPTPSTRRNSRHRICSMA